MQQSALGRALVLAAASSSSDSLRWLHTHCITQAYHGAIVLCDHNPDHNGFCSQLVVNNEHLSSSCVCAQLAARSGQSSNRPPGPDVNQGTGPGPRFRRIECPSPLGDGGGAARSPGGSGKSARLDRGRAGDSDSDSDGARSPTGFERQSGTAAAGPGPRGVPSPSPNVQIEDGDATDRDVRLGVTARALSKTPALATEPLPVRH